MKKRARSRRKLQMFSALPAYLGGKRKLASTIFRELDRVVPRRFWHRLTFLDSFMGGASIALFAKAQGFRRVIGTDLALRSVTVGQALVANSRVRLTKEDVLGILEPRSTEPGPVEREFVPSVFCATVARTIDRALDLARASTGEAKAALFRLLGIRVALLAHPYSQIRSGTAHRLATGELENITPKAARHYVDSWRLATVPVLWKLAQEVNQGVFEGNGEVRQVDVLQELPSIVADVMYADPPYAGQNVMSYERQYAVLDRILEGVSRPTSPFTARGGSDEIDGLLARAVHIPVWILSFGNVDCNLSELEEKMRRLGRETRAQEIRYQHLPAVATQQKRETNRELLVAGWDPCAPLFHDLHLDVASSLEETLP